MAKLRYSSPTPAAEVAAPLFAIVGRPNVGKSTLFNRLVGRRRAIVGDEPGITRDRLYGEGEWRGRHFRVVDTGGIIPEDKDFMPSEIFRQARVALDEAAAIIMVVDARTELAASDLELARLLQRSGKPLFLAVNKMDSDRQRGLASESHRLGIRDLFPISAEHGLGLDDLLDAVIDQLKLEAAEPESAEVAIVAPVAEGAAESGHEDQVPEVAWAPSEIKVAIIGRPNVGKSTLLNQLTGADRAIVSPIAGTTRDAVDETVERDGKTFRFIDTAGIRRKGKTKLMAEKLSVVMARKHLEAADIALLMVDAEEGVTSIDANIAGYAHESGRSVIIVVNKWDLVVGRPVAQKHHRPGDERAAEGPMYEKRLRNELKFLAYAPVLFVSATSGKGVEKVFAEVIRVAAERRKRVSTSEMNRFLATVDFNRATVPARQRVRVYYMTQAAVAPPTFLLFTDKAVKLHFSYVRYLENQIRRAFGFAGTPIWIKNRPKK
jgi:GTP-binding protein